MEPPQLLMYGQLGDIFNNEGPWLSRRISPPGRRHGVRALARRNTGYINDG